MLTILDLVCTGLDLITSVNTVVPVCSGPDEAEENNTDILLLFASY